MWLCRAWRPSRLVYNYYFHRRLSSSISGTQQHVLEPHDEALSRVRNIGIIAHIDAGKTTTTERMLYYSGATRRIGNVDDGSTVTDFLPAERARGITIQSAAVTLHWPPLSSGLTNGSTASKESSHAINLIDTPGHADFTFEVIRSLRILDGAVCILDGVAGVEAQTEKVWKQASGYQIPRIIYVNKLDRDGASFHKTVKDVATRLDTWPLVCHIPWWDGDSFIGVGDAVNLQGLRWEAKGDGQQFERLEAIDLERQAPGFFEELRRARKALGEALSEHDKVLVEEALNSEADWQSLPSSSLWASLRRVLLGNPQIVSPIFAGASFRNIGVQPLLDGITALLPSPAEAPAPDVSVDGQNTMLKNVLDGSQVARQAGSNPKAVKQAGLQLASKLTGCALAFKVVNDVNRGVLVYIRVYSGSIKRSDTMYNTMLGVAERAQRLFRMYADDAQPVTSIDAGQIGVISGLENVRTGDTLIVYSGMSSRTGPPWPINTLQLRPIVVPPPLWYVSLEPHTLSDEKHARDALAMLLREDPSLTVSTDAESGQTHLAGMGELHLEIARDRLINDMKVKAVISKIAIGYRETVVTVSATITETISREMTGKTSKASCAASVEPLDLFDSSLVDGDNKHIQLFQLDDGNVLTVYHPNTSAKSTASTGHVKLPNDLPFSDVLGALRAGAAAAASRGPSYALPVHSTHISITFDQQQHLDRSTTIPTLRSAARLAVFKALRDAASKKPCVLMEPVMNAKITVNEDTLGEVVQDLTSARGAHILSLGEDGDDVDDDQVNALQRKMTPEQLRRVYAPPDPYFGSGSGVELEAGGPQQRQIRARVPLREMVGYLNRLRSLTAGRGTFVMSIDRFEKMSADRMKSALADIGVIR